MIGNGIDKDDSYDSIYFDDEEEIQLYKGIMNQKISKKNIVLSNEITKKKKIVNRLFKDRFGKNFIPIKLESLKAFESFVRFYLFSPTSKILSRFPKLKKRILHEKDINYNALKDKINIGSLLYLNLSGNGTTLNKNINEKFFQISKNLSTTISKDTISNSVYNVKFLKKNVERINKILSDKGKGKTLQDLSNKKIKLSNINNIGTNNNNYKGRNFTNDNLRTKQLTTNKNIFNKDDNFKINIINENLEDMKLNTEENNFPSIDKSKTSLNYFNKSQYKPNFLLDKYKNNILKKYNSRNNASKLVRFEELTENITPKGNNDHSEKVFSPYKTFSGFNNKHNLKLFNQKKFQNDINKYVENLNEQTDSCNKKLIRLINGNLKEKKKTNQEENQEVINLKNILIDKKNSKKKKKVSNIKQIKNLIKRAKLDFEGEANLDKIKKKELKKLGHYLNEMNNDFALYKVNELYTKGQLKREGKNFSQEELQKLRKKKIREIKVFRSRNNSKMNYLKMVKMKNNLILIKDKFDKVDIETRNRTIEINKKNKILN
jgi:hypothetical protein